MNEWTTTRFSTSGFTLNFTFEVAFTAGLSELMGLQDSPRSAYPSVTLAYCFELPCRPFVLVLCLDLISCLYL